MWKAEMQDNIHVQGLKSGKCSNASIYNNTFSNYVSCEVPRFTPQHLHITNLPAALITVICPFSQCTRSVQLT